MFRIINKVTRVALQNPFVSKLATARHVPFQSFASTKKPAQEQTQAPQTIQISKQEYQSMVKFMQDIKYSDPSVSFPPASQTATVNSSPAQQIGQLYFSSDEHKLSFQLMKLNSPLQYLPHFEANLQNQNLSVKLIILYMYCMAGGIVRMDGQGKTDHLSYQFMSHILENLSKLDENQLERFLQLYVSLHKTEHNMPTLNLTESTLPLIKQPSHHNSSLLTLLIQFVSTCNLSSSPSTFQPLQQILKHYKIQKAVEVEMSELKQLAYIGMTSIGCGFVEDDCLDSMMRGIQHAIKLGLTSGHKAKIIEAYQVLVVKLRQLKDDKLINKKLEELLLHMKATILAFRNNQQSQGDKQINKEETFVQDNADKLDKLIDVGSGKLSALLYETMLVIEHGVGSGGLEMCLGIIEAIVEDIGLEKDMALNEYEECWKSTLIMMRLKQDRLDEKILYPFVNSFLAKCHVTEAIRGQGEDESENLNISIEREDILFNILLSYRMILPPSLSDQHLQAFQNCSSIEREVGDGHGARGKLKELIEGYRSLIGKLYEENVVVHKDDAIINHLTIVCFIADAYKFDGGLLLNRLLDERVQDYLFTFGIKNEKYRLKIESLVERNKNYNQI